MKTILRSSLLLTLFLALAAANCRANEEQDQIAILKSGASAPKKWAACQRLRIIGTAQAVPAVAALLGDERLSQAARQTLEGLPYPEVDEVLRQALDQTSGLIKAGIIDSIGWHSKGAAVPYLSPLLKDSDTNVAGATATALGRIGGQEAVAALTAARDQSSPSVELAVQAALLQCAEKLADSGDTTGAVNIYNGLTNGNYNAGIRTAAWRGVVLSDPARQTELMQRAVSGDDLLLRRVALKLLRELANPAVIQACAGQWDSLSEEAQLAVLDAAVKQGQDALPIVIKASQSSHASLRVAAWTAMGELNDVAAIPALAKAASSREPVERQAARDSLARLHGPGSLEALLSAVGRAEAPEKAELLLALGARGDANATKVLLQNAAAGDDAVRVAALQSLGEIAPPEALAPLLGIAAQTDSDDVRDQAIEALTAICQASPDKETASRAVLAALKNLSETKEEALLPLLPLLGTDEGLNAALADARSQNVDLAKQAVRVLAQWPNAAPAQSLLELARTASDPALRTLALRGAISVNGGEPSETKRLDLLKQAFAQADRPDEKKEVLSGLGLIASPEALDLTLQALDDPNVSNEAALATVSIAEKVAHSNPDLAEKAAGKVLLQSKDGEVVKRAWALRLKPADVPFIRDWVLCGPYTKRGVTGPIGIFDVPLGPEKSRQAVKWKPAPSGDSVNLASIFPGAENCAAYLRTTLVALHDCPAILLLGSDDGVKAWLNHTVVHANNVNRPQVVDQDVVPVQLKKGVNELVLKISQGGGGWSACARIVGADGHAIPGVSVERPTKASEPLTGGQ